MAVDPSVYQDEQGNLRPGFKQLTTGAIFSSADRKIVAKPASGPKDISSSEMARRYVERRALKRLQAQIASQREIKEVSKKPSAIAAHAHMAGVFYKEATEGDAALRDRVLAGKFVAQLTGLVADERETQAEVAPGSVRIELGAGVVGDLLRFLAENRSK